MPNMRMKGGPRAAAPKGTFKRILKSIYHFYPRMLVVVLILIVFNAVISALPSIFMQRIFTIVGEALTYAKEIATDAADVVHPELIQGIDFWAKYGKEICVFMFTLISLYVVSLVAGAVDKQLMAIMTQGYLKNMRGAMFNGMQELPIKYFDTHSHGDIMSYYTNDIDTLRQLISQSLRASW